MNQIGRENSLHTIDGTEGGGEGSLVSSCLQLACVSSLLGFLGVAGCSVSVSVAVKEMHVFAVLLIRSRDNKGCPRGFFGVF